MQDYYADTSAGERDPAMFGAYRLTTAEIVYSDTPDTDAAIVWRDYDLTPGFPRLRVFLDRLREDPERRVRSVTVTEIAEHWMPACRISPPSATVH